MLFFFPSLSPSASSVSSSRPLEEEYLMKSNGLPAACQNLSSYCLSSTRNFLDAKLLSSGVAGLGLLSGTAPRHSRGKTRRSRLIAVGRQQAID